MICNLIPLAVLWPAWRFYREEAVVLEGWRRIIFLAALVANTISAVVLLSFTAHALVASYRATQVDLDSIYPVFSMLALGVLTAVLAVSGRRISRLVLIGNGLLWYLVGLAASR
jgi:hypothetical protein